MVYDSVGRSTFEGSLDCLAPMGLMVSYGNASGPVPPVRPRAAGGQGLALPDPPHALQLHGPPRGPGGGGPGALRRHPVRPGPRRGEAPLAARPGRRRPPRAGGAPHHRVHRPRAVGRKRHEPLASSSPPSSSPSRPTSGRSSSPSSASRSAPSPCPLRGDPGRADVPGAAAEPRHRRALHRHGGRLRGHVRHPAAPAHALGRVRHPAGHGGALGLGGGARHRGRVLPGRAALRRAGQEGGDGRVARAARPAHAGLRRWRGPFPSWSRCGRPRGSSSPASPRWRWPGPATTTLPGQLRTAVGAVIAASVAGGLLGRVASGFVAAQGGLARRLPPLGGGHRGGRGRDVARAAAGRVARRPLARRPRRDAAPPRRPAPPGRLRAGLLPLLRLHRRLHLPALPARGPPVPALHRRHRVGLPGLRGGHRGVAPGRAARRAGGAGADHAGRARHLGGGRRGDALRFTGGPGESGCSCWWWGCSPPRRSARPT